MSREPILIQYGQTDPAAKYDSTPDVNDIQPFADIRDLRMDNLTAQNFMTLEPNNSVLDGTGVIMPDDMNSVRWGWFTQSMSDASGYFANPPRLDVTFTNAHKSNGLTLYFYPFQNNFNFNYACQIRVTWWDMNGNVILSNIYTVTSPTAVIKEPVENYKSIRVELLYTNNAYRFAKIIAIDYGILHSIQDGETNTVNIVESIDPISNELSINTLKFNVLQKYPDFDILGHDANEFMMKKQKIAVYKGEQLYGVFFLDTWTDKTLNAISYDFTANDGTSAMEQYEFLGGLYSNVSADSLISQIFSICFPTGMITYRLDPAFADAKITGYIPICNCRQALQYICFALGAAADTTRRNFVWIYPCDEATEYIFRRDNVYRNGKLTNLSYVSQVDVIAHDYVPNNETVELFRGILPSGQQMIRFSNPAHNLTFNGGTILAETANYAVVYVIDGTIEVLLTGLGYTHNQITYSAIDQFIQAGEVSNTVLFDKCYLVNSNNAQSIAGNIFDYYHYRTKIETDVVHNNKEVGYKTDIALQNFREYNGIITNLDINLRANKAKATIVGNVKEVT